MRKLADRGGFRADIQGLRGIAVLLVVLFHAGLLSSGFVGVDVFFVISGFVVSRSLLAGMTRRRADAGSGLRDFYLRRLARLLPAFSVAVLSLSVVGALLAPIQGLQLSLRTARAGMLLASNVFLYRNTPGYFTLATEDNFFLHLWSLSVEEQFYLSFPILLFFAVRLSSRPGRPRYRQWLPVIALSIASLVSLLLAVSLSLKGTAGWAPVSVPLQFSFYAPITRAWEFGVGAVLATLEKGDFRTPWPGAVAVMGGCLLVVGVLLISEETPFPGWAALLPVLGTGGLIASGGDGGWTRGRALVEAPLFLWMGDISYSWYLWHWPLMVFAKAWLPDSVPVLLVAGMGSLLPSWLSYRYIENRFRIWSADSAHVASGKARFAVGLGSLALVGVMILLRVLPGSGHPLKEWLQDARVHLDVQSGCDRSVPVTPGESPPVCEWNQGAGEGVQDFILIGDSNAGQFSEALLNAGRSLGRNVEIHTHSACPLSSGVSLKSVVSYPKICESYSEDVLGLLRTRPPSVVFFSYSMGYFDLGSSGEGIRPLGFGGDDEIADRLTRGTVQFLETVAAAGHTVVFLEEVPKFVPRPIGRCSALQAWIDFERFCTYSSPKSLELERVARSRRYWEELARVIPGSIVLGFLDELCPEEVCNSHRNGASLWRDEGHISVAASEGLAEPLARGLKPILEQDPPSAGAEKGRVF